MARILVPDDLHGLHGRIAIDVETVGGHAPHLGKLMGLGVWCEDAGVIGYLPHENMPSDLRDIVRTWRRDSWLLGHNLKYEFRWMGLTPHDVRRFKLFDTAVAEHLIDENVVKDLGSIEVRRLKTRTKRAYMAEATRQGLKISDVSKWPPRLLADYCENDVRITYAVARLQAPILRRERLDELFLTLMEYLVVLHGAEQRGMLIDPDELERTEQRLDHAIAQGEKEWRQLLREHGVDRAVNYRSAPQLSKVLYEDLGIEKPKPPEEMRYSPKTAKFTKTATGKDILKKLRHPVPEKVLYLRQLKTVRGYLESYRELAEITDDGLVLHPEFNLTGTVTGRLSSANPNVQQIKASKIQTTEDGEIDIRGIFRARPGYVLAAIDYQQMEAAVFGLLARDPQMIKIVKSGGDLHEASSRLLLGGYDKHKRKIVKTLNFGILYGLGRAALAEDLGVSISEGERLLNEYFRVFRRARPFMSEISEELGRKGFVRYWSGRKRRIADPRLHYKGVNSVIQGGCADVVAHAAVDIDKLLRKDGGHLLAIIHDEMVLELPEDTWEQILPRVKKAMSMERAFGVPLNTDALVDTYWSCK